MDQRMWGADAEALAELAQQMHTASARLDTLSRSLSAALTSSPWQGGDAERFRADWNRVHRVRLHTATEFLAHASTQVSRSGQQQAATSAESGGHLEGVTPGASAGWQASLRRGLEVLWGTARETADTWQAWASPLTALGTLAGAATVGRYTDGYRGWANLGELMQFKQSPVLQALDRVDKPLRTLVDNPAFKTVDDATGWIAAGGQGIDTVRTITDYVHGEADLGDLARVGADDVATGLKTSKNPVTYLAGVNVSIWSDVVQTGVAAAQSGDLTLRGLPSPFSKQSFTEVYLPTAVDVARQLRSMAGGWL